MNNDPTFIYPHDRLLKEYKLISKKHIKIFDFYLDSLKKFDKLFDKLHHRFAKLINDTGHSLNGRYVFIMMQMKETIDSHYTHYFALKKGACNGTYPALRHSYESLLKNYYFLIQPMDKKNFINLTGEGLSKTRKTLYSEKMLKRQNKIYDMLCVKTHAGVRGSAVAYMPMKDSYKDCLELGVILLSSHYVLLLDSFGRFVTPKELEKIIKFIEKFQKIIGSLPNFMPDNPKIVDMLKISYKHPLKQSGNRKDFFRSKEHYFKSCFIKQ